MKQFPPESYIYAVGKIRALEKYLIQQEVFEEAKTAALAEALRLFVEYSLYSEELLHVKESFQLEAILEKEQAGLKSLVKSLLLDEELHGLLELDCIECVESMIKRYKNDFIEDFARLIIDTHNIKTFLRLRALKEPQVLLGEHMTCEGFIKLGDFRRLYGQDIAAFLFHLENIKMREKTMNYRFYLWDTIEDVETKKTFITFERDVSDLLVEMLKPAKLFNYGPEPVVAYYFFKTHEIRLIRLIALAKINELPQEILDQRVNQVFA